MIKEKKKKPAAKAAKKKSADAGEVIELSSGDDEEQEEGIKGRPFRKRAKDYEGVKVDTTTAEVSRKPIGF